MTYKEVVPGVFETVDNRKNFPFKWENYATRRGGITGRGIRYEGCTISRKSEIVFQQGEYAIIKNLSYTYRSGQTAAAGMQYVPTTFQLIFIDEGNIESSGRLTVLSTLECGHKWKLGVEYLKCLIETLN